MTKPAKPPRMTPANALTIVCRYARWHYQLHGQASEKDQFDEAMRHCRELARILKPKDD